MPIKHRVCGDWQLGLNGEPGGINILDGEVEAVCQSRLPNGSGSDDRLILVALAEGYPHSRLAGQNLGLPYAVATEVAWTINRQVARAGVAFQSALKI